ncbi:phosphonoacetaldehyde methylase [Sphingomonas sp. AAP5]|uniref:photosynthetic complex assembly protein PuhC n=1 Tax=Sphingomonas sp. AAP5 TaxID=1523415 RepID=UPI001056EEB4|nr:photosynthetic complex assembly protein PuhC [Sphingomonas sp. AAP5]QBM77162.1 phosphonoacetaldehyde methylase [Sphingomonas sp. AAP5]
MTHAHHAERLPRGALILAGSLVGFAFLLTATVRIAHIPPAGSPAALRETTHVAAVQTRTLRFLDAADRGVRIEDVGTGQTAGTIVPGQETGFIRGVMRGLARERRMHGIGSDAPFTLTQWRDGELTLTDSATGRSIELNAFGTTNRAAFAALLRAPEFPR